MSFARHKCWFSRFILGLLLAVVGLGFWAPLARADTEVGGPIFFDTTWTAVHSPYIVIATLEIWEGVTLTIEPGVTVRFQSSKSMKVSGGLVALGTENEPIIFTSDQASPEPGDWGNIEYYSTALTTTVDANGNYLSGSVLRYCMVEYAGYDVDSALVVRSQLVDHCTIRDNDARGIYARGGARVTNSTLRDNRLQDGEGVGIYAYVTSGEIVISKNHISNKQTPRGGGVYIRIWVQQGTAAVTMDQNIIADNPAGDGIYVRAGSWDNGVAVATITNNIVTYNAGHGINVYAESRHNKGWAIVVSDNHITSNWGGGIRALAEGWYGPLPAVADATVAISNNTVTWNWENVGEGAGIWARSRLASTITISNCIVSNNGFIYSDSKGGGVFASCSGRDADVTIANSRITSNRAGLGGGVYADYISSDCVTLLGNVVSSNSASTGGGIYAESTPLLSSTITLNTAYYQGAGIYYDGYPWIKDIQNNTIVGNRIIGSATQAAGGVSIRQGGELHGNNLYGNEPYDVVVLSYGNFSGTNNYWGTTDSVQILKQVYDWYDDSSRGQLHYVPYSVSLARNPPLPSPTNLRGDFEHNSVALSFDPPPDPEISLGYKVHYDSDLALPPYEGTGLTEGDSPIDLGSRTTRTLTGLDPAREYHFVVTTYDAEGHESWYSNIVSASGASRVYLPLVFRSY